MRSGLRNQLLNRQLGVLVATLSEMVVADGSFRVHEVEGRPVVVVEGAPDRVVVVDRDRGVDAPSLERAANVGEVVLEAELRRVNADDNQPLLFVLLRPRADV